MKSMPSVRALALLIAGALHALSFAVFDTNWSWVVSLVCLAGLAGTWFQAGKLTARVVATFAFGLGWFVTGLYWLHITMHNYGGIPWLLAAAAVVLFCLYLASFSAVGAIAFSYLARRELGFAVVPLFAACITAADLARGYLFTGFPWLAIGYAQIDSPLAHFAPIIGVYGVGFVASFLAALLAYNLAGATNKNRRSSNWVSVTSIAGGLGLAFAPAVAKFQWVESTAPLSVALVQTNFLQAMKFDPRQIEGNMLRVLEIADATKANLVVFPETVWPVAFEVTKPGVRDVLRSILAKPENPTLALGLPYIHATGEPRMSNAVAIFNSASQIDSQSPSFQPDYLYSKKHLVPFGEFIPMGFGWFVQMLGLPLGEFRRGLTDQPSYLVQTTRVAFNICYEDLFGEEIALQARDAQVLINISNLGWFNQSMAIPQHLNISRMRALETQRPMLRSTNTGATAHIAPNGKIIQALPYHQEQTLAAKVNGTTGLTPYVRWQNWPVIGLCFAIVGLIATWQQRRRL
jgi:apolipoprotein N-acyltransferase